MSNDAGKSPIWRVTMWRVMLKTGLTMDSTEIVWAVVKFPVVIVYLVTVLLIMKYSVVQLFHTYCRSGVECVGSKIKFGVSEPLLNY